GGKGQSHFVIDVDLVDARKIDFRRILGGGDVGVLAIQDMQTGVQRDGLAAARRTGDEDHALGLRQVFEVELLLEGLVAERIDPERGLCGIENTQHDLLAEQRGAGTHAEVDGAILGQLHLDAAVLGDAPLSDVEARHDLETSRQFLRQLHRRLGNLLEHPVHAKAHAVELLERLEVNIRSAAADGIQHDLVDEAHDRGVFDIVASDLLVELVLAAGDFQGLEIDVRFIRERRHLVVDLLDRLVDRLLELVVLDNDGFYGETRLKLVLVDGVEVGRIRYRQKQSLAATEHRQDAVLGEELVADESNGLEVQVHRVKIEQRHAEFVRGRHRDVACVGRAARHQLGDDARLALARDVQG